MPTIDIDPAEIGKIMKTQIPVVGDSKVVLQELIKQNGKQGDCQANGKNSLPSGKKSIRSRT
ncbi:hypothetical protein ACRJ4B_14650 [Streptomyces sp. GTA36]